MKQLDRLHNIKRRQIYPNLRPKDAASLLIFDLDDPKTPRVLMGRRHPKQEFIPDKLVFPGGRVSQADSRVQVGDHLSKEDEARILFDMKGRPSKARARAIAMAAIRETFEETGILIGANCADAPKTRSNEWCGFFDECVVPALSQLTFIARAITPPRTSRRYDTRFFIATKRQIMKTVGEGDGEFTETHWMAVHEADQFDLHPMSRNILDDAMTLINPKTGDVSSAQIPYYFMQNGVFQRRLID